MLYKFTGSIRTGLFQLATDSGFTLENDGAEQELSVDQVSKMLHTLAGQEPINHELRLHLEGHNHFIPESIQDNVDPDKGRFPLPDLISHVVAPGNLDLQHIAAGFFYNNLTQNYQPIWYYLVRGTCYRFERIGDAYKSYQTSVQNIVPASKD